MGAVRRTSGFGTDGISGRLRVMWRSSVGKKIAVAVSGLILALFVVVHMLGNLKLFEGNGGGGDAAINSYARFLRTAGHPVLPRDFALWGVRAILIVALIVHVVGIYQLSLRNRRARPAGHHSTLRVQRSLSSRAMQLSGVVVLAFIVFHVLQFTTGTLAGATYTQGAVYANLYNIFQKWWFVAIYVVAMVLLGLHLKHGLWSMTQSTGFDTPDRNRVWRLVATVVSALVLVGFAVVPITIWTGATEKPSPPSTAQTSR